MKATIWLSFDLGIRGNYEELYRWLDDKGAKECGANVAFLTFTYKHNLLEELKAQLIEALDGSTRTRIYVVRSVSTTKGIKGEWLVGGRKSPPWSGFGSEGDQEIDV
jgi:hypothetical protein